MKARTVESASHRCLYIEHERLVRGGGVYAVGIESLVKNKAAEYGLAVKLEAARLGERYLSKTEVSVHYVHTRVTFKGEFTVVKAAVSALPKVLFGKGNVNCG